MLDEIKSHIEKLISLYEAEKQRADELSVKLQQSEDVVKSCREQITELNHKIDNLALQNAFSSSGDNLAARSRIDKLVREIDKCIVLLEEN